MNDSPLNLSDKRQAYLPKLDGLRAISILLVLVEHFSLQLKDHGLGTLGVTIFFVISGYLITTILMSYVERFTFEEAAITFYWRRTLRLFPAYYVCIALAAVLAIGGIRQSWLVNALYLSNFKIAFEGAWNGSSHFWSLAIEEQFYFLWFIAVMSLSRIRLRSLIVSCLIGAPMYRWAIFEAGKTHFMDFLLPGVMDSLAMGALLACASGFSPRMKAAWRPLIRLRTPLLWLSLGLGFGAEFSGNEWWKWVAQRSFFNIFAACLVVLAIAKERDWRVDWLGGGIIRHFGKISYGIYVYHYFVPQVMDRYLLPYHAAGLVRFLILAAISVGLAELSWFLMERPILRLKDRIPFKRVHVQAAVFR